MHKSLFAGILLAVLVIATGPAQDGAAEQETRKGTTLFVLTRQAKVADAAVEDAQFEVSRAATFELLMVEIFAGKLDDRNSYLGRYYEHPVRREGKKLEFGVYAKAQLKPQTKLANFKLIGDRVGMKFFSGAIGTVNVNPADKKARPTMDTFYIYQVEAFDPK